MHINNFENQLTFPHHHTPRAPYRPQRKGQKRKRDTELPHTMRIDTLLRVHSNYSFLATIRGGSSKVLTYYLKFHCSFQQLLSPFSLTASNVSSGSLPTATLLMGFCLHLVIVQSGESPVYNCLFYHEFKTDKRQPGYLISVPVTPSKC